jgi:integrase/recombinase XerC
MTDELALPDVMGQLVRRDLLEMAMAGLSPQTLKLYKGDWKRFLSWAQLDASEFFGLEKADAAVTLNRYLTHLAEKGLMPATRARAKQAICSIIDRLYAADALPWTLAKLKILDTPRVRVYKDVEGLPHEDWQQLLSAAESDGSRRGCRDVAVLLLLHDSALRRREVATLRLEDYDGRKRRVMVWGKGRDITDRDSVPLSARTHEAIQAWIKHRRRMPGALFTGIRDNSPIDEDGVAYVVRYWCRAAGISEVGPHQLRHAAITRLARRGAAPALLQRFARHQSFDTTMHYIHGSDGEVRKLTELLSDDDAVTDE